MFGRFSLLYFFSFASLLHSSDLTDRFPNPSLETFYFYYAGLPVEQCDIGEHMSLLKQLAFECPTVTEIGLGLVISTWAILEGLSENFSSERHYIGIDIAQPPEDNLALAQKFATERGIDFTFQRGNDLYIDIESTDLLFIDSMHTYCHLSYELDTFSPKVRKYIAMHDTSEPWGDRDDIEYLGDYSEYPPEYSRTKRGLWQAVEDFLVRHPEWELQERHLNCHGFTILRRITDK